MWLLSEYFRVRKIDKHFFQNKNLMKPLVHELFKAFHNHKSSFSRTHKVGNVANIANFVYVADFSGNSYCNSRLAPISGTMCARHDTGHYNGLTKMRLKGGPQGPVLRRWSLSHLITDSHQTRRSLGDTRQLTNTISARSPAHGLYFPYT